MRLETLREIARRFEAASVRYLVVGGVAVNAHGYQRLTNDLDLVVGLEAANLLAALDALAGLGYRPVIPVTMQDFANAALRRQWIEERNLEVFSLVSERHIETTVDVFATEPFDFDTEYEEALRAEVDAGLEVPFIRLETLVAMKEVTGRPRDMDDVEHLKWILEEQKSYEPDD